MELALLSSTNQRRITPKVMITIVWIYAVNLYGKTNISQLEPKELSEDCKKNVSKY
jgi:hypothetical protein